MRLLIAFTILILGGLVGTIALDYSAHDFRPTLKIALYDDLTPGSPIPQDASCYPDGGYEYHTEMYCRVWRADSIYIGFSGRNSSIGEVSFVDERDSLGDLFLVWGRPNGYECDGTSYTFYWNDRSAYIVPRFGLSLYSTVGYVRLGSPLHDYARMPSSLPVGCERSWS